MAVVGWNVDGARVGSGVVERKVAGHASEVEEGCADIVGCNVAGHTSTCEEGYAVITSQDGMRWATRHDRRRGGRRQRGWPAVGRGVRSACARVGFGVHAAVGAVGLAATGAPVALATGLGVRSRAGTSASSLLVGALACRWVSAWAAA